MKKTICLVTNWYPTKENPFMGLFFKEQAFAVSEAFDFVVVHFQEYFSINVFDSPKLSFVNQEENTVEYTFDIPLSPLLYFWDAYENFKVKHIDKNIVDGIGMYVSDKRKNYIRNTLTCLFKKNVKESVDAFYCIDAQQEAYNVQCLAKYYNKPYIVAEHAPVPWPGTLIKDVNKYAIENANMFLAISNDKIRQLLLQNIKLPEVRYIGNLIDETKFSCKKKDNEVKTFIIVAAHSFYKNYDLFISVMNRLTDITDCPFKVMIVGYGANKGYSKDVKGFEEKIWRSKFANRVVLIPEVPHEQIGETLNKADAFVMTSIQEGQPVSALEAACCGLPIFSTRCGGVEDYVDEGIGRLYSVLDCEGMAQGLKEYLEGKIEFDSNNIRERVVSKYGNRIFLDTFKTAFNKVINCG